MSFQPGRRRFLAVTAGAAGALIVGWREATAQATLPYVGAQYPNPQITSFVRIDHDGNITIGARGCEVGQGVKTGLPMLIAEELDVDWGQIQIEQLPYGYIETDNGPDDRYGDQGAGGDVSAAAWTQLRQAGAVAHHLLMQAAAQKLNLPLTALFTAAGQVIANDGRKLAYGDVAAQAAKLNPPKDPLPLKSPDHFNLIGTPVKTVDAVDVVTGHTEYACDAYLGDTLVAVVSRCPWLDGALDQLDDSAAKGVRGVRKIVSYTGPADTANFDGVLTAGVAVLADDAWSALKARDKLKIKWKPGRAPDESSDQLADAARKLLESGQAGIVARNDGDFATTFSKTHNQVRARYEMPFLAHATLEPPNALIHLQKDRALLIAGLHDPDGASNVVHAISGIPRDKIEIRLPRSGGDFGRRLNNDFVAEATLIAQSAGGVPVKLLWTRQDDLQHDFYRPFGIHDLRAGLDRKRKLTCWSQRCAATPRNYRDKALLGQPSYAECLDPGAFPAGVITDFEQVFFPLESRMPRGDWCGNEAFSAFAVQCFLDEIAHEMRRDPVDLRLELLSPGRLLHDGLDTGRLAAVLQLAADSIDWKRKRYNGHGLGIACHGYGDAYAAHAFEISINGDDLIFHRAICAIDAGRVLNPQSMQANVAGATIQSVSSALHFAITLKKGQIEQHNFPDYNPMRMRAAPHDVDVHIVPSSASPVAPEDVAVASAAPALANAIYAASTVRVRKMPLMPELLRLL